jgi:XTP/dITP diphosphohydrolase
MIDTLVVATRNTHKLREIKQIFQGFSLEVIGLNDLNVAIPEVIEDGQTFAENARKKAITVARVSSLHTLADDSGLCVDALGGEPGVFSARYAGTKNDEDNIDKLLTELSGVPLNARSAHFVCAIAFASPQELIQTVEARCDGVISMRRCGQEGFGYDPVFLLPELNKTFAELLPEQKNRLSHRFKALAMIQPVIAEYALKKREIT